MRVAVKTAIVLLGALLFGNSGTAQTKCTPLNEDVEVGSTLASAGFFANLSNSSSSIHYRMDDLLDRAKAAARKVTQQEADCARSCGDPVVAVFFQSVPNKTLTEYDEASVCDKLLADTTANPIVYGNRSFPEEDEAKDWYNDLTQGDGADGEDLYKRCPGKCSPTYASEGYQKDGKFIVTTSIVCGHARDKDDNQYRLNASLRWVCP